MSNMSCYIQSCLHLNLDRSMPCLCDQSALTKIQIYFNCAPDNTLILVLWLLPPLLYIDNDDYYQMYGNI